IDIELLAQEARRRGLDKKPEVELGLAQALRDEVLDELRRELPGPEALTEREVRDYYEAHLAEFREPERRRALLLVVAQEAAAKKLASDAQGATGAAWGELVRKHSLERRGTAEQDAVEWAGDFGFVSPPGEARGENAEVPEPVRTALFQLKNLGEVAPAPVSAGGRWYVVRLGGTSPARDRSLREADRTIRVELVRQRYVEKERALEAELRQKFPVVVDEQALSAWKSQRPATQP
ncbi:MAG TPA: peptidylprolyl isomerase, partial [Polyangiaceae bacterium]|nr:peptidylprolyl isomerase [Polyangiaceae bacterium]